MAGDIFPSSDYVESADNRYIPLWTTEPGGEVCPCSESELSQLAYLSDCGPFSVPSIRLPPTVYRPPQHSWPCRIRQPTCRPLFAGHLCTLGRKNMSASYQRAPGSSIRKVLRFPREKSTRTVVQCCGGLLTSRVSGHFFHPGFAGPLQG